MRSVCGLMAMLVAASVAAAPAPHVSVTRSSAKDYYAQAHKKFVHHFDMDALKPTLAGLTKPAGVEELSAEGLAQLKAARKSGAVMRSLFVSLDRRHEPPARLHAYVRTFGKLNDAIEANVPDDAAKEARALLKLVKKGGGKKILVATEDFQPTSGSSFREHVGGTLEKVRAQLARPSLPIEEFHAVRKDLKVLMNLFELDKETDPAAARAHRFLSALNDKLGPIHDEVVQRSLRGEVKYDDVVVPVPKALRDKARAFLSTVTLD